MALKDYEKTEIVKALIGGATSKELADKYGVTDRTIRNVFAANRPKIKYTRKQTVASIETPQARRPMLALVGDRDEIAKTIKELFS